LPQSAWAADENEFDQLVAAALMGGGPTLIAARIDGKPAVGTTTATRMQIASASCRGWGSNAELAEHLWDKWDFK
jgi:hypothetical protein